MSHRVLRLVGTAAIAAAAVGASGCAAFRAKTTDVDVNQTRHMGSGYDYSDMRKISQNVVGALNAEFLAAQSEPPIVMIAGVQNRTSQYVDTKNLTDRVRTMLIQGGKARFVNEARREDLLKEQGFSAANATPETQVAIGKQLGAKYMVSGSLTEMKDESPRQVRVSKTKVNYYKLTFEVTDVESAEIKWIHEEEFAREARLPLIGW
ncbi:MAG: hypothetical protein BWK77_00075 [Verrucomicrobia bacterium A1]|nr:MAG: hypothetical protein BWK77_00075 [Verrucomicrobia bacterium A1]